ncbi:hypothetical protein [Shinella zoogloeoides]|uniref:hypothetical protein n=1 Tax=Shinella zoogloeoides TaxID=352475 RepID=UPI0028A8542A|nr:hypothetical protein [Shinella zoogloeoides]
MLTARPSTPEDVAYLAPRLRHADVAEVLAAGGASIEESLMDGLASPDGCFTAIDENGNPVLMFGTAPHPALSEVGCIWLLASDEIAKHRTDFLRNTRPFVERFHQKYPLLMNYTDCRNTVHHRWLRWCGFSFINIVKGLGPGDHPFYEVVKLRNDQCVTPSQ